TPRPGPVGAGARNTASRTVSAMGPLRGGDGVPAAREHRLAYVQARGRQHSERHRRLSDVGGGRPRGARAGRVREAVSPRRRLLGSRHHDGLHARVREVVRAPDRRVSESRRLPRAPRDAARVPEGVGMSGPIVLVHGVPDTYRMWDRLRTHLTRRDVVAVSLPGFDAALPPGFVPTKEAYADWLVGAIERIGTPVDLVGHDWGSLLVQRVVSIRPDLIRTWACGDGPVDVEYVWHDLAQQWQTPGVGEAIMEVMTEQALAEGLPPAGVPPEIAVET